jgi:broad specificity phosphatase PhoE
MTRILLVRHGESEWNAAGRWQGWADPPLTPLGRAQALAAARSLSGVDVVVSSDLRRAVATAEAMAGVLGLAPVHRHAGLRERDVGEWTGLTRAEIDTRWPGWRDWAVTDSGFIEPPGGEAHEGFLERTVDAVGRVAKEYDGRVVVAVTHGGLIRMFERHLGIDPDAIPNLAGRWLTAGDGTLEAGERVVLVDPEEIELTIPPPH